MANKPNFKTWRKSLDIAGVEYNESDFYNNIENICVDCLTKLSKDFYTGRYSCIFSEETVDMIYEINKKYLLSNRRNPYDPISVANANNISLAEAEKIVKERKNNTSGSLENFIRRHGEIEGKKRYQEFCKKCIQDQDKYIKKYGELRGRKKYQDYVKSKSPSLEMNIKRYGEEEGKRKFDEVTKRRTYMSSLEGQIEKYGEAEGKKRYDNSQRKKATTKESLISKYGEEEGKKRYQDICLKKSKSRSLQSFIEKYGEEKGKTLYKKSLMKSSPIYVELRKLYGEETATKIYMSGKSKKYKDARKIVKDRMQSVYIRSSSGPTSKQSTLFFEKLKEYIGIDLIYGGKKQELKLFDKENMKTFFYDAYNKEEKIIIEYHGVAYHPREGDYDWVGPFGHTYAEVRARDEMKKQAALVAGYRYIEVWSDETLFEKIEKIKKLLDSEGEF